MLLASMPGVPPFSYVLAAYVKRRDTRVAHLISDLTGIQDWNRADAVGFPAITFATFVADATAARGGRASAATPTPPITVTDAVSGLFSAVSGFVDDTLKYISNLLQRAPSNSSFLNFIAD
jgi:hypothetical protein